MIIRIREKPRTLQKMDALIPRLSKGHPQLPLLRQNAAKLQKGYNGERRLDYYLQGLPSTFNIFSDVCLDVFGKQIQIDSLVVTPHSIFILEVKNYEGTLTFDTNHRQLIQTNKEMETAYSYPLNQTDNLHFLFMQWLDLHGLSGIPIHSLICIAKASTIIQVQGNVEHIAKFVVNVDEVPIRLMEMEEKYKHIRKENNQLKNKITSKIMEQVKDFKIDIFKKYGILKSDILFGTRCLKCYALGLEYYRGIWHCPNCDVTSKTAHLTTINDYFLLQKSHLQMKDAMEFFGISNRFIVHRILKKSNLKYQNKGRFWLQKNK